MDVRTCAGAFCLAGGGLAWAARRVSNRWDERTVPLLGVLSAFIFAGQMVNFPVAGGTSGHLFGGVLASAFLGPAGAALAIAAVLSVQCFLFQDGGVTALGANFLNLGMIGVGVGYGAFRLLRYLLKGDRGVVLSAMAASALSVMATAAACAFEMAGAGVVPLRTVLFPMLAIHALIAVGEASITGAILSFVLKVRPELLYRPLAPEVPASVERAGSRRSLALGGLAAAFGVALLAAPWASVAPDGLERVAEQVGLAERMSHFFLAPLAGYEAPFVSGWMSASTAAAVGTALTFGLAWGLARMFRRSPSQPDAE